MPFAHLAVDLCQTARAAQVEVAAAPHGSGPAIRARYPESAEPALPDGPVAGVLAQPAQDQPALGRRYQGQPVRDQDHGSVFAADQRTGWQLPLAASPGAI